MNIQFDVILKNALVQTVLDEYENVMVRNTDASAHVHNNNGHCEDLTGKTVEGTGLEDFAELLREKRDTTSNCLKQSSGEDLESDE